MFSSVHATADSVVLREDHVNVLTFLSWPLMTTHQLFGNGNSSKNQGDMRHKPRKQKKIYIYIYIYI